jgi:hypothetical protein
LSATEKIYCTFTPHIEGDAKNLNWVESVCGFARSSGRSLRKMADYRRNEPLAAMQILAHRYPSHAAQINLGILEDLPQLHNFCIHNTEMREDPMSSELGVNRSLLLQE